jgi:hypothetical protein
VTSSQIEFRRKGGGKAYGYPAELLPKICQVFIDADNAGKLNVHQKHIPEKAPLLLSALGKIGIIALVDEATQYQNERPRDDLQKILSPYISPTLLPWAERFPMEFYREMFRVYGWPWPYTEEDYPDPLGPRYVGKLVRQIIFENLPPGVLEKLDELNPADAKCQRKRRMTQLLSSEMGRPHVEKLVAVTMALFKASDNKDDFWKMYKRSFPKKGDQYDLL